MSEKESVLSFNREVKEFSAENLGYEIYDDVTSADIYISNTANSLAIVGKSKTFDMNKKITEVKNIGSNILSIGDYCFYDCENLSSIGGELSNIEAFCDFSFYNCKNIKNLKTFDEGLSIRCLGSNAFARSGLEHIKLNLVGKKYKYDEDYETCRVTNIDDGPYYGKFCFASCDNLKSVEFLKSNEMGEKMFADCINLTSITFKAPHGSCVKQAALSGCTSLEEIKFPKNFEIFSSYMFAGDKKLKNINFDQNSTKFAQVEDFAFKDCILLSTITFPKKSINKITSLNRNALAGSSLTSIIFNGIDSTELYKGIGNQKIECPEAFQPQSAETKGDEKYLYGKWYGTSPEIVYDVITFAKENKIPLYIIFCGSGCSYCKTLVDNVLSKLKCLSWVANQTFLFGYVYDMESLPKLTGWYWGRYFESFKHKDGGEYPTHIKWWPDGNVIQVQNRGIEKFEDLKAFIGDSFKAYKPQRKYYSAMTLPPEFDYNGWGLTHNCDFYTSDGGHFLWNYNYQENGKRKPTLQYIGNNN